MIHHAGSNHVEIDIDQTPMQVLVGSNGGCVVAILPERTLLTFALVVLLGSASSDELHALCDDVYACVFDQ